MNRTLIRLALAAVYALACSGAFIAYVRQSPQSLPRFVAENQFWAFLLLFGLSQIVTVVDFGLRKKRLEVITAIYFGLVIGLLLALLLRFVLTPLILDPAWKEPIDILLLISLPYFCTSLLLQTKDDYRFLIPYVEFSRTVKGGSPVVLDSSALIDGRIVELARTGLFDVELQIPEFVLSKLQEMENSDDRMAMHQGRRGLDAVRRLQEIEGIDVRIDTRSRADSEDLTKTDTSEEVRMVRFAKQIGAEVRIDAMRNGMCCPDADRDWHRRLFVG